MPWRGIGSVDASRGAKFAQDVFGADETASLQIAVRLAEGIVQGGAICIIEPVAGVQRQERHLGTLGQICRLIEYQSTRPNACLQRHGQ